MHPYKDMLQEFLTQRVRLYRLKYNYSQETMSVFLRISARAYFDLEHGNHVFSACSLIFFLALLTENELRQFLRDFEIYISE